MFLICKYLPLSCRTHQTNAHKHLHVHTHTRHTNVRIQTATSDCVAWTFATLAPRDTSFFQVVTRVLLANTNFSQYTTPFLFLPSFSIFFPLTFTIVQPLSERLHEVTSNFTFLFLFFVSVSSFPFFPFLFLSFFLFFLSVVCYFSLDTDRFA